MWRNRNTRSDRPRLNCFDELFEQGASPAIPGVRGRVDVVGRLAVPRLARPRPLPLLPVPGNEIVPWVDARYRTKAHRDHRAITGKSSGGATEAMVTAMLRPDLFGALVTHSGDALF